MESIEEPQPGWSKRFIDYFVVCGLGLEVQTLDSQRGFHGLSEKGIECVKYLPQLLDQYPSVDHPKFSPPPQLPAIVLPGGVEIYDKGPSQSDESTQPRSYPVVLTGAEGDKIHVSVVTFRDPVEDDVAHANNIPPGSYADKCICLVSHWPFFDTFRDALEEIHRICFSSAGCSKPLWETVAALVTGVPLPDPGQSQILFSVESCLLHVETPEPEGLPFAEVSFRPLVQCLDIDNIIRLVTSVLLEKRILLRASKFELLTVVAEAVCHLCYPFRWMYPYIPVLPYSLLELFDIPGSYLFGLSTTIGDVSQVMMHLDGVIVVDLDNNKIVLPTPGPHDHGDEIPAVPEPELGHLRMALLHLIHPNIVTMDKSQRGAAAHSSSSSFSRGRRRHGKPWGRAHDQELRYIFLRFLASLLNGYRNYVDNSAHDIFNKAAFLKKRNRSTGRPPDPLLSQLVSTQGWYNYLERGLGSSNSAPNLLDRVIDAGAVGRDPMLPSCGESPPLIVTISDAGDKGKRVSRHTYDRFPAAELSLEQAQRRKDQLKDWEELIKRPLQTVSVASKKLEEAVRASAKERASRGALESLHSKESEKEREAMVVDIKQKLSRLWTAFLELSPEEDPISSGQYGTIYAMIDSDEEGIGGSGFVECLLEHFDRGWDGELSEVQFNAVKELIVKTISRATVGSKLPTVLQALLAAGRLHRRDAGNVQDPIERHIGQLPVWQDFRFWEMFLNNLVEAQGDVNHAVVVPVQLVVLAEHMAELVLADTEVWALLEALSNSARVAIKYQMKLRGVVSLMQQRRKYFGIAPGPLPAPAPNWADGRAPPAAAEETPDPATAARAGWMAAMFSKDGKSTIGRNSRRIPGLDAVQFDQPPDAPSRERNAASGAPGGGARGRGLLGSSSGGSGPTYVRLLRGARAPITALHAGTRAEVGDLMGDGDDVGYFVSGSLDGKVILWDPSVRGQELRHVMGDHSGAVRCLASDRTRLISGGEDARVLVFDKTTGKTVTELFGHEDAVGCVRMLSGNMKGSVLSAGWDGAVKVWDMRSDQIATTVVRWGCPVLCIDYLDHASMLAAAGTDGVCHVWDIRAGKERYKLAGHTNWVRTVRMVGDAVVTGGDDWTARVWTLNDGQCEAVLACHGGPVTCVETSPSNRGIITASADCTVRLWDRGEGTLRCVDTVGVQSAPVVAVRAGERWLAIAAADNSMSLFHRPPESAGPAPPNLTMGGRAPGRRSMAEWRLLRTLTRVPDTVRHVACDVDRGRIVSGGRNGILRLWEPPPPSSYAA